MKLQTVIHGKQGDEQYLFNFSYTKNVRIYSVPFFETIVSILLLQKINKFEVSFPFFGVY